VLAYYCGNTLSWKFEGVMMMSKTREMNPASKAGLEKALAAVDLTFDDLCFMDPEANCPLEKSPLTFNQ